MSTLEQWRFEQDGGDWEDVVRRARRRIPLPGRAVVAAAAVLVLAAPALGLVGTFSSGHARPPLAAELTGPGGATGTFTAFAPGVWIAKHGGRRIPFTRTVRLRPLPILWSVRTDKPVTAVRIRNRTLCNPCRHTTGMLLLEPRTAVKLLLDTPIVQVTAGGKTLRGKLMVSRR